MIKTCLLFDSVLSFFFSDPDVQIVKLCFTGLARQVEPHVLAASE